MFHLLMVVRLIAALTGSSVERDWACWENVGVDVPAPRYQCEYAQERDGVHVWAWANDTGPVGLYFSAEPWFEYGAEAGASG